MTTTIALLVSIPLIFQNIATRLCNINQSITPTSNVCWAFTKSPYGKPDIEMLDNDAMEYMTTEWTSPDAMLTKIQTETDCWEWTDANYNETTTCE